jgi:hypothetical protein
MLGSVEAEFFCSSKMVILQEFSKGSNVKEVIQSVSVKSDPKEPARKLGATDRSKVQVHKFSWRANCLALLF